MSLCNALLQLLEQINRSKSKKERSIGIGSLSLFMVGVERSQKWGGGVKNILWLGEWAPKMFPLCAALAARIFPIKTHLSPLSPVINNDWSLRTPLSRKVVILTVVWSNILHCLFFGS